MRIAKKMVVLMLAFVLMATGIISVVSAARISSISSPTAVETTSPLIQSSETGGNETNETGNYDISSTPSGASVYIDDVYQGLTPIFISDFPVGSHTTRLSKYGYDDWSDNRYLGEGQTIVYNATLEENFTGTIDISSNPSGANIYLDDVYKGITPKIITCVPEGFHDLKLSKLGYQDWIIMTYIDIGQTRTYDVTLTPSTEVDANQSFVNLTMENCAGLTTCPSGDGLNYNYVKVTVKNYHGDPMEGVWAENFSFIVTATAGTEYFDDLSCTFTAVDSWTNSDGEIRFSVVGDTSIVGDIIIKVIVNDIILSNSDTLSCISFDSNVNGRVDLSDFCAFSVAYGSDDPLQDFNWDGIVNLADFAMFQLHYGHRHGS